MLSPNTPVDVRLTLHPSHPFCAPPAQKTALLCDLGTFSHPLRPISAADSEGPLLFPVEITSLLNTHHTSVVTELTPQRVRKPPFTWCQPCPRHPHTTQGPGVGMEKGLGVVSIADSTSKRSQALPEPCRFWSGGEDPQSPPHGSLQITVTTTMETMQHSDAV